MKTLGLTGGIGSGKSTVSAMLAARGAALIDADANARAVTAAGGAAIEPIRSAFGAALVGPDGALDRARMRELAFSDTGARGRLEAIIHPLIGTVTQERAQQAQGCYLVLVVPLLVESGRWRDRVDRICVVDCDPATQAARVQARSGLTADTIARIMSVQASREERLALADDVVLNDAQTSLEELARRARVVHERWCLWAQQRG